MISVQKITETFEPTLEISEKMQEQFCQAVIQNFKNYVGNLKNKSIKNYKI